MKTVLKYLALLFLTLNLSSCLEYKEVKVVEVLEVGVKNISPLGINVEVVMQIKNPNKYNISIVSSDLNVFIKGNKLGTAVIKEKVTLKKKSNAVHRFTLHSSFKDIGLGGLPTLLGLMSEPMMEIHILGTIKAQAKGINKKVPIDFTEKVKL